MNKNQEYFKKGQLVPKRLNVALCHKKQRQHILFGADCIYDYSLKKIFIVDSNGPAIKVLHFVDRIKTNNGTYKRVTTPCYNITCSSI